MFVFEKTFLYVAILKSVGQVDLKMKNLPAFSQETAGNEQDMKKHDWPFWNFLHIKF